MTVDPNTGSPDASGGQFDYSGPDYGATGGGGSTDYDPGAVAAQLKALVDKYKGKGHVMPEGVVTFVMYLMQEYGLQVVGQDANIQTKVNNYFGQIHTLYNDLNAANTWKASDGGTDPSVDFRNQLNSLLASMGIGHVNGVTADPFFTKGAGESMVGQMSAALEGMEGFVNTGDGSGCLEALWSQYNGSNPGVCAGDPTGMNSLTSLLGEITQQFTGISKSVQATTQSDSAQQSTEQSTLNNFLKKLNSCILYMLQQQKTQ